MTKQDPSASCTVVLHNWRGVNVSSRGSSSSTPQQQLGRPAFLAAAVGAAASTTAAAAAARPGTASSCGVGLGA